MENPTRSDFSPSASEALKTVQNIIARLSNNSFMLKGWTITTVVVTMLLGKDSPNEIKHTAFIPIFMFWLLDSYYLHQERLFRKLHSWIATNSDKSFSEIFDFNIARFKEKRDYLKALFALVEAGFYLPIAIFAFVIISM